MAYVSNVCDLSLISCPGYKLLALFFKYQEKDLFLYSK